MPLWLDDELRQRSPPYRSGQASLARYVRDDPACRDGGNGALVACAHAQSAEKLHSYAANVSAVSVSGVSAGGYMAVQFHVAHSAIVRGAGILAAGPYYCAQGSSWAAQGNCMKPDLFSPVTATPLIKTETDTLGRAWMQSTIQPICAARAYGCSREPATRRYCRSWWKHSHASIGFMCPLRRSSWCAMLLQDTPWSPRTTAAAVV